MDEEKTADNTRLQWHPAFYAGIQIEFEEESDELIFESEYQLGTKPKEVDVLVTKKHDDYQVKKNIGRFFRKYNLIEYKPPKDSLNIDDFYKLCGYGCFYKADSAFVNGIKIDEITITFVTHSYPREMLKNLGDEKRYEIEETEKGIYYIKGGIFPIQLIVTRLITEKDNFWLWNLNNKLKTTKRVYEQYQKHSKNKLYKSVMDIIVKANGELFKEGNKMCQALFDLYKDELMNMAIEEAKKIVIADMKDQTEKLVEIKAQELAEVRAQELAEVKAQELAEVKAQELAEVKAQELAEVKAQELAEVKAQELAEIKTAEVKAQALAEVKAAEVKAAELFKKELKEKQRAYIESLINNAHFTLEQALNALMIPEEERKLYNLG